MLIRLITAACGALMIAAPTTAQERDFSATIVITGSGRAEAAPDTFTMAAEIVGTGPDQAQAVEAMVLRQTQVSDAVSRLDGLQSAQLTTGLPSVEPVYASDCARQGTARAGMCEITGYVARLPLSLKAQPANRGGDAVSLAAERGATGTRLESLTIADHDSLRREATQFAFENARLQAEVIANASGRTLGRVLKVEEPEARNFSLRRDFSGYEIDANYGVVNAATPIRLSPDAVSVQSTLIVTFAIE